MCAQIQVIRGIDSGRRIELSQDTTLLVGRHPDCTLQLDDPRISGKHCSFDFTVDGYVIEDLRSTNGVLVNGSKIRRRVLKDRDRIAIGNMTFCFMEENELPQLSTTIIPDTWQAGDAQVRERIDGSEASRLMQEGFVESGQAEFALALRSLFAFSSISAKTRDPKEITERFLQEVVNQLEADRACLVVRDSLTGNPSVKYVATSPGTDKNEFRISQSIVARCLTQQESILSVGQAGDGEQEASQSILDLGIQSILCVPVSGQHEILGALYVDSNQQTERFNRTTLQILSGLAHIIGLGLEKQELSDQVQEAQIQLEAIYSNAPIAIFGLDQHGSFHRWSDHATNLFGHTESQALSGLKLLNILENPAQATRAIEEVMEKGSFESELSFRRNDASTRIAWCKLVRLRSNDDRTFQAAGYALDLTEHHRLLHHSMQQEKLAGLGLIMAGVIHDIKNLLQSISGYAQLGEMSPADSQKFLATAGEHSRQAMEKTRDLLNFARGSTDKKSTRPNDIVQGVLNLASAELRMSSIESNVQARPTPVIRANTSFLQDAILNIILNAKHAMPDGGKLTIQLGTDLQGRAVIEIEDTGVGIPEDQLDSIFEPFVSSREDETGDSKGTGLGLYMVRQVIEEHGGTISVTSTVDVGTRFTIRLPSAVSATEIGEFSLDSTQDGSNFPIRK
ncbi:MAG: ATP-binding protein [Planctomycetota bacterium]|nr:ATP-binding protein [Planctomycetota bacterium]